MINLLPLLASVSVEGALPTTLILLGALVLLATEWVRPDVTAMAVVVSLFLTGVLTPEEALAGLGNPVVVTIAAMFVLGHAVLSTGAASQLERAVLHLGGRSESRLIAVSFLAVALLSAWVQNIAGIVLILPAIIGVARRRGLSASRLLMPLAAASLTGGMCTLVGSPANLALDGKLREMAREAAPGTLPPDLGPVGMFETLEVGLAMTAVAVLYYAFAGPKLLPARRKEEDLSETWEVKEFLAEVSLRPGSELVGAKLVEARLGPRFSITVMGISRDGTIVESPDPWTVMREGDVLLVQGEQAAIMKVRREYGSGDDLPAADGERRVRSADLTLAEIMPSPGCRLINRPMADLGLTTSYGLHPLAVSQHGDARRVGVAEVALRPGDVILVQGHDEDIERLRSSPDWVVLQEGRTDGRPLSRALIAAGVLVGVIAVATLEWLPLALAAVAGVITLVVAGIIRRREIYQAVEWPVVVLIAGILPLGVALEKTGVADSAARFLADTVGGLGPYGALACMFLLGTLLTGFLNNAALTLMLAPVAIHLAGQLDISPRPLLFGVAIGATADFLTPVGQSNAMVMGPGRYRFRDFVRVGGPMTLLALLTALALIPAIWPFHP